MRHTLIFIIGGCLLCSLACAAQPGGADILRRALDLAATIKDYSAEVRVTVDMPNVQVPERRAKVYYKRPDKVAIDSKGIVMIPKKALVPGNLGATLDRDTKVVLAGTKRAGNITTYFLKVTPPESKRIDDRLLFWVRGDRWTVERMEVISRGKQQLSVTWEYQQVRGRYWMPRRLVATVAPGVTGRHGTPPRPPDEKPSDKPGLITVLFTNVKVNSGLSDSLFVEPDAGKGK